MLHDEELTDRILGAAIEVHRTLGPGLLESTYETCLSHELFTRGLSVIRQHPLPIVYKDIALDAGYRIDLLVENRVIIELKHVEKVLPVHEAQLLTYLKLSKLRIGLILNFNVRVLKDGIVRRVL